MITQELRAQRFHTSQHMYIFLRINLAFDGHIIRGQIVFRNPNLPTPKLLMEFDHS